MSLWDKLRGEFIDIVEWTEPAGSELLAYRFPRYNNEIKMGAKLTVREGQAAAFVNEGQLADVYKPGMYTPPDGEHADPVHAQGLEIRLQFAVQGRGLLHLDEAVDRPEMGHAEPDHAARSGVRPGSHPRFRHLCHAASAIRGLSSSNSSPPIRASRRSTSPTSCAT